MHKKNEPRLKNKRDDLSRDLSSLLSEEFAKEYMNLTIKNCESDIEGQKVQKEFLNLEKENEGLNGTAHKSVYRSINTRIIHLDEVTWQRNRES